MAGQSVNPALNSHREVLKKVISEEEKELEENYRGSMAHALREAAVAMETLEAKKAERLAKAKAKAGAESDEAAAAESDESESDSNESGEEKSNKPVNRLKKLTKNQRN